MNSKAHKLARNVCIKHALNVTASASGGLRLSASLRAPTKVCPSDPLRALLELVPASHFIPLTHSISDPPRCKHLGPPMDTWMRGVMCFLEKRPPTIHSS